MDSPPGLHSHTMDTTTRKRMLVNNIAHESNKKAKQVYGLEHLTMDKNMVVVEKCPGMNLAGVEKDPDFNYAYGSPMAFSDTTVEEHRRRPHDHTSFKEYPSIQDVGYPRTDELILDKGSDITLVSLMRPCTAVGGPVLRVGDIVTFHVVGDHYKEVEIIGGFLRHTIPTGWGPLQLPKASLLISIPPGQEQELTSAQPNLIFPNGLHQDKITAPQSLWMAARTQYPPAKKVGIEGKNLWDRMSVTRGTEELGTLHDMRLALQFGMNESDFAAQLTFSEGRHRGSKNRVDGMASAGFFLLNSGTLFLKVPADSVAGLNQDLLIDIGQELNEKLAELAEEGFAVVLVESRGCHNDGIPTSERSKSVIRARTKGPNAFPTEYTRSIAGHAGWTNGYAHIGFPSLCRNDEGEVDIPAPFKYLYRTPALPTVKVPEGEEVLWKPEEKAAAISFYEAEMKDKIRHYPLPMTRSRRPLHIRTMQYRKVEEGWIVDPRLHPEIPAEKAISDEEFTEAMKKERTRPVPAKKSKERKSDRDEREAGAAFAAYETLGRRNMKNGVPRTGRHATIEERFAGHER